MRADGEEYPGVMDNRQFSVEDRANELAEGATEVKVAVGFFYVGGFDLLKENLQDADTIQLIIGKKTDLETKEELEKGFEEMEKSEENREGVRRLHQLIQKDQADVRIYTQSRFHPKLYLFNYDTGPFPGAAIVGSSNLSFSGLRGNVELNVEKRDELTTQYLNDWFDDLWEESEEFKSDLLEVIENSKFQEALVPTEELPDDLVSPYTATKLYIYEQFTEEIEEGTLLEDITGEYEKKLAEFQNDAVRAARYTLNKYNGVILSDSVGLGKSYIGAPLVQEYSNPQSKVLVITPKRLEDMWKRLLSDEFPVRAQKKFISFTKLSLLEPNEINQLRDYDVILIDESHKLRNRNTNRYSNLQGIGRKDKKYIMLTATPIQNSVRDLENIIKIFADDSDFDIDLRETPSKLFKKYEKLSAKEELTDQEQRNLDIIREDIEKVMQEVLISRTREYILDNYDDIRIDGEKIKAPDRIPHLVKSGDSKMEELYRNIINMIVGEEGDESSGLNLPYVSVDRYRTTVSSTEEEEQLQIEYKNAGFLLVILLFKRLESSIAAFEESIDRLINREKSMKVIAEGDFDSSEDRQDVVQFFESLDRDGSLDDVDIDEITDAVESLGGDERTQIVSDVKEDLSDLKEMRELAKSVLEEEGMDAKATNLKDLIMEEFEDEKVLIFTQFVRTAEHIFEQLTGADPSRKQRSNLRNDGRDVAYVHGDEFDTSIIEQFAPKAQEVEVGFDDEIDVLIATDVLGMGQNLQDSRVVINYDLHWNPMRMEQRIGRIDRITTEYDELLIYNFIPTKDLEDALGILDRIRDKINDISATFGHDAPILEESEKLVDKNMIIYDQLSEGDVDFSDEGLIGVTSKYDQLRNAVKSFCETCGITIEDLQQTDALRNRSRIAFKPDCDDQGILGLVNLTFTNGRTETRASLIDESGITVTELSGQTQFLDIPISEDDPFKIFNTIKTDDKTKNLGDVESVKDLEETLSKPNEWNNKILKLESSPSREVSRILDFCREIIESDEFDKKIIEKAKEIKDLLEDYELSDFIENELDKDYRKRNRWGWERTVLELHDTINQFQLTEPEKVAEAQVVLTEKLG